MPPPLTSPPEVGSQHLYAERRVSVPRRAPPGRPTPGDSAPVSPPGLSPGDSMRPLPSESLSLNLALSPSLFPIPCAWSLAPGLNLPLETAVMSKLWIYLKPRCQSLDQIGTTVNILPQQSLGWAGRLCCSRRWMPGLRPARLLRKCVWNCTGTYVSMLVGF